MRDVEEMKIGASDREAERKMIVGEITEVTYHYKDLRSITVREVSSS